MTTKTSEKTTDMQFNDQDTIRSCIKLALDEYFRTMDGHHTTALYELVLQEVEAPLLESVLNYTRGNQSRAAEILGLNRGTLRKKLKQHRLA